MKASRSILKSTSFGEDIVVEASENSKKKGKNNIEIIKDEKEEILEKAVEKVLEGYLEQLPTITTLSDFSVLWKSYQNSKKDQLRIINNIEIE